MSIFVSELADYMKANGFTDKITKGRAPPTPDVVITLYDTGGFPPDVDAPISNPTVTIQTRGDYETANTLAWRAMNLFNRKSMYTLTTIYVKKSFALTPPLRVGLDEEKRDIFNVNLSFSIEDLNL